MAGKKEKTIGITVRISIAGQSEDPQVKVRGPSDVFNLMHPIMQDLPVEEMHILALNTAGAVTNRYMASKGGLSSAIMEPRAAYQFALLSNAAAIVCVHNHPSGNPEPSAEDIAVTRQLVEAGRVMGIPLRDHIIIAGNGYTSLAERGAI